MSGKIDEIDIQKEMDEAFEDMKGSKAWNDYPEEWRNAWYKNEDVKITESLEKVIKDVKETTKGDSTNSCIKGQRHPHQKEFNDIIKTRALNKCVLDVVVGGGKTRMYLDALSAYWYDTRPKLVLMPTKQTAINLYKDMMRFPNALRDTFLLGAIRLMPLKISEERVSEDILRSDFRNFGVELGIEQWINMFRTTTETETDKWGEKGCMQVNKEWNKDCVNKLWNICGGNNLGKNLIVKALARRFFRKDKYFVVGLVSQISEGKLKHNAEQVEVEEEKVYEVDKSNKKLFDKVVSSIDANPSSKISGGSSFMTRLLFGGEIGDPINDSDSDSSLNDDVDLKPESRDKRVDGLELYCGRLPANIRIVGNGSSRRAPFEFTTTQMKDIMRIVNGNTNTDVESEWWKDSIVLIDEVHEFATTQAGLTKDEKINIDMRVENEYDHGEEEDKSVVVCDTKRCKKVPKKEAVDKAKERRQQRSEQYKNNRYNVCQKIKNSKGGTTIIAGTGTLTADVITVIKPEKVLSLQNAEGLFPNVKSVEINKFAVAEEYIDVGTNKPRGSNLQELIGKITGRSKDAKDASRKQVLKAVLKTGTLRDQLKTPEHNHIKALQQWQALDNTTIYIPFWKREKSANQCDTESLKRKICQIVEDVRGYADADFPVLIMMRKNAGACVLARRFMEAEKAAAGKAEADDGKVTGIKVKSLLTTNLSCASDAWKYKSREDSKPEYSYPEIATEYESLAEIKMSWKQDGKTVIIADPDQFGVGTNIGGAKTLIFGNPPLKAETALQIIGRVRRGCVSTSDTVNVHMYVTQLKESMDGDDKLWTGDTIALSLLQESIGKYRKELAESREKLGDQLHTFSNNIAPPNYFEELLKYEIHTVASSASDSVKPSEPVSNKPNETVFTLSDGALKYEPRREFTVDVMKFIINAVCGE